MRRIYAMHVNASLELHVNVHVCMQCLSPQPAFPPPPDLHVLQKMSIMYGLVLLISWLVSMLVCV